MSSSVHSVQLRVKIVTLTDAGVWTQCKLMVEGNLPYAAGKSQWYAPDSSLRRVSTAVGLSC